MAHKVQTAHPGSMEWIRETLVDSVQKARRGKMTPANVNSISNATGKILATYRLEMEYYKLIGKSPNIPLLLRSADGVDEAA
jgi:hypothetical protein